MGWGGVGWGVITADSSSISLCFASAPFLHLCSICPQNNPSPPPHLTPHPPPQPCYQPVTDRLRTQTGGGKKHSRSGVTSTRTCIKKKINGNKGTPHARPGEAEEEFHQLSASRLREAAASPVNTQTCHCSRRLERASDG